MRIHQPRDRKFCPTIAASELSNDPDSIRYGADLASGGDEGSQIRDTTDGDAVGILTDGVANCGGFATVLTACLRNVGIPARGICGFWEGVNNWHVRVEFHLPGVEWLVADPTAGNAADPTGTYAFEFRYVFSANKFLADDVGGSHMVLGNDYGGLQGAIIWWNGDPTFVSYDTPSALWPYPPAPATNPSPANAATGQSVTTTLTWSNGFNAASYAVYFGPSNPPAPVANQNDTSYDPGVLNYSTSYYWRIDAVNDSGTATGTVWSFTTEPAPPPMVTITVQANPSNGGTVSGGGTYPLVPRCRLPRMPTAAGRSPAGATTIRRIHGRSQCRLAVQPTLRISPCLP